MADMVRHHFIPTVLGLVALLALGCMRHHPRPHPPLPGAAVRPPPVTCTGAGPASPRGPSLARLAHLVGTAQAPMGRLEVERLSEPLPAGAADPFELGGVRVRIVAENVPFGAVAVALGQALPLGVVVDASLAPLRVSLFLPNVELEQLVRVLAQAYRAELTAGGGLLLFARVRAGQGRQGPASVPEIRLVPAPDPATAAGLAETFCRHIASRRGVATVVGSTVVLQDDHEHLTRGMELIGELSGGDAHAGQVVAGSPPVARPE